DDARARVAGDEDAPGGRRALHRSHQDVHRRGAGHLLDPSPALGGSPFAPQEPPKIVTAEEVLMRSHIVGATVALVLGAVAVAAAQVIPVDRGTVVRIDPQSSVIMLDDG